ncbi:TPA: type 4a pilus biogenesis protein PilF [Pseudomonas aeruginosa]|nr:type 4a pilus biogenesis protein PilF [Pseudomonas aeruginosa]HCH7672559.1 type 4a pilus biogenesis protein PilF [Pseudomonas aeruginosa]HCH9723794.1 type 4a pilus biogenesis protein PilF [Pseudomonas aeruginosa]HCI3167146.1 type 4a pilus biogenesis protein PilF [Pseudomonas aeruginosa]HCI3559158.1 type 4a pilus biogenesis protein PilF [Pseudomonas aeruginosa]
MTVRAALVFLLAVGLTGCVTSGDQNHLKTDKGRDEARDAYIQLGLGYLQRGNTEQAKVPLRKALEIDPSSADAHAALAVVFQTEMEPKLADEEYRKALASDSRNARVLNNYGGFLYEQKRYEEAYQRLLEASQDTLYPERSRVFENLGLVSLQMKKPAQAKEYFEKSLRLNRNQPSVALEMADLLYKEREYVPARQYYDLFAQGGGQNARSLLLGIRLAKVFEDRDTAASYGLQLKRLYPGSPEYQEFQAEK